MLNSRNQKGKILVPVRLLVKSMFLFLFDKICATPGIFDGEGEKGPVEQHVSEIFLSFSVDI